jgi:hypothetical protein
VLVCLFSISLTSVLQQEKRARVEDNNDDGEDGGEGDKAQGDAAEKAVVRDVRDVVTPLWKLPYASQLVTKQKELNG